MHGGTNNLSVALIVTRATAFGFSGEKIFKLGNTFAPGRPAKGASFRSRTRRPAIKLLFHAVGAVKLVDKATLIEFFHEISIDQVFRL